MNVWDIWGRMVEIYHKYKKPCLVLAVDFVMGMVFIEPNEEAVHRQMLCAYVGVP